ncbi:ubiquinone anaerobic biosynthesis accessory factor UbiT [Azospirillum rugosum]|uniref:Lipid carrier protein YhbT n=1 Tax=Azospirillum rugosum TaxID=416170 RepID=A0ABS4SR74_9PROT|nr:SCP2 sterol-binding domain-containing protein [Azospirillum rugosum]MBP2295082.1 putative lipid carrier protein YhbT [Azospirillum rugosum]MDQ0528905.1 putative lipid carrier protein YhbT [Azospirillum rugosum]
MRDPGIALDEAAPDTRARAVEVRLTQMGLGLARRFGDGVGGRLADRVLRVLSDRHPRAFTALRDMPEAHLLIDPVDAPAAVLLRVGPRLALRVCDRDGPAHVAVDAAVRGPCARLLDLLEGRIDGDALFFRRELVIEGDTALILALRNTLDGEDMDLFADMATAAGPLRHALPLARRHAGRMLDLLGIARRAAPPPLRWGMVALERRLGGKPQGS